MAEAFFATLIVYGSLFVVAQGTALLKKYL